MRFTHLKKNICSLNILTFQNVLLQLETTLVKFYKFNNITLELCYKNAVGKAYSRSNKCYFVYMYDSLLSVTSILNL